MDILKQLNLTGELYGAYAGEGWHSALTQHQLISCNPASGEMLATLSPSNTEDCEYILKLAEQGFHEWKKIPAAKRGELIRLIAVELRRLKHELGYLICLEMGKSLQESLGEVQEMIDMADLAIGQSRMLYGNTMHSERACHRLYEQWQPLGVNLVITSFNFPMAVWAWNAFIAAVCGNTEAIKQNPAMCNSYSTDLPAGINRKSIACCIFSGDSSGKANFRATH